MMSLPFRMAIRETTAAWRHFTFFFISISLGVYAIVSVGVFAANLDGAIHREARNLMAADVQVRVNRPLTADGTAFMTALQGRGITIVHASELVAMAAASRPNPETQLIELKAVEPGYPFYGKLVTEPPGSAALLFDGLNALAQESLLIHLNLAVGETVRIGQADFRIVGVLKKEPDRAAGAFSFGPRMLISQKGLADARLVQPGSRVTHRYLLKLPDALGPGDVRRELADTFPDRMARISSYEESQPMLRQFLGQLTMYLGLVALIALIVGGIGVAASVRAFLKEKMETIAVLKVLGATPATILQIYVMQTLFLGLLGSVAGAGIGVAIQFALPLVLRQWLPVELEFHWALLPLGRGIAMGMMTTALFALWPLLEIQHIRPNLVFRREVAKDRNSAPTRSAWAIGGILAFALAALALWQAGSWRSAGVFIGALILALGLLQGSAWGLVRLAKHLPHGRSVAWRQGMANLHRPGSQTTTVVISVGIAVMLILAIHLVEQNMLSEIGENAPSDSPTFFFIDIQPDQHAAFKNLLTERGYTHPTLTPLVRSRLSALNRREIRPEDYDKREHGWYFTREYVLTFQQDLPKGNVLLKGKWWHEPLASPVPRVSVEEEAARRLGLDLGSTIEFDIQGAKITGRVSNIRKVDWGNLSTNFYFIFEPGALDGAPMTYVATARVLPKDEVSLQRAVVAAFPNVSAINIRDILESVTRVLDRISLVIRFMAGLTILAGMIVLAGALAATRFQRIYEAMILKAIGATRGVIARMFIWEYSLLGAAAGVIGAVLATGLSWAVMTWILDVQWRFQPIAVAGGILTTVILTVAVGFLSTFRVLGQKPLPVLRQE